MTLDPGANYFDIQYEAHRASSYDTPGPSTKYPRRKHRLTQDTSALAVKSDQETQRTRLSLGECFLGVDVFFYQKL
jgi:hypothetical protein